MKISNFWSLSFVTAGCLLFLPFASYSSSSVQCLSLFSANDTQIVRPFWNNFQLHYTKGQLDLEYKDSRTGIEIFVDRYNNAVITWPDGSINQVTVPYGLRIRGINQIGVLDQNTILFLDDYHYWRYDRNTDRFHDGIGPSRASDIFIFDDQSKLLFIIYFVFRRFTVLDPRKDNSKSVIAQGNFKAPGQSILKPNGTSSSSAIRLSQHELMAALDKTNHVAFRFKDQSESEVKLEIHVPGITSQIVIDFNTAELWIYEPIDSVIY